MRQRDRERLARIHGVAPDALQERVVELPSMRGGRPLYSRQVFIDRSQQPGRFGIDIVAMRPLQRVTRKHLLLM